MSQYPVRLSVLAAATASALVNAQAALDERARDALLRWEDEAFPPAGFAWTAITCRFPLRITLSPKHSISETSELYATGVVHPRAGLRLGFRYRPLLYE